MNNFICPSQVFQARILWWLEVRNGHASWSPLLLVGFIMATFEFQIQKCQLGYNSSTFIKFWKNLCAIMLGSEVQILSNSRRFARFNVIYCHDVQSGKTFQNLVDLACWSCDPLSGHSGLSQTKFEF